MSKYKYSIIIPHKNIVSLLVRCLDSIPDNFNCQIIVVDDESNKETKDILYKLQNKYTNLEIYESYGKGAGAARNIGINHANGEWIIFADADDFFLKDAFELIEEYARHRFDIVYFAIKSVYSRSLEPARRHLHKISNLNRFKNYPLKLEKWLRYEYTEPWGKMFRTDFIRNNKIIFYESKVANDYLFSVMSGYMAKSISFSMIPIYCVTIRENSLCNKMFDINAKIISRIDAYIKVENFLNSHNIALYPCSIYILKALIINIPRLTMFIADLKKINITYKYLLLKAPYNCIKLLPKKLFEVLKIPYLGY